MLLILLLFALLFFLTGTFFLTALNSALRRLHKRASKKLLLEVGNTFFYLPVHRFFFPHHEFEGLLFATVCAQNITRFFYGVLAILFLMHTPLFNHPEIPIQHGLYDFTYFWIFLSILIFIFASVILGDYLPRVFGIRLPEFAVRFSAPFSSLFLIAAFPITYPFLRIAQSLARTIYFDHLQEPEAQAKQDIIDLVQQAQLSPELNPHDKKLFESVLSFREILVREVMVPRVEIFSLPIETSVKEAARFLESEGYSRTPVYKQSIDNIVGVLMYKDLLKKFQEYEASGNKSAILDASIENLLKPVLYTPESKKLSMLLQEFRKKKVHLAIVVDEYGGTEGIVTFEDILEEIVGPIADEYDQEELLYYPESDGSWTVDPRMSILDAEEQLGLKFPEEGDYDTIGGYIFFCAGSIPSKGFIIHRNDFEIEILKSNERFIEKVRIRPLRMDNNASSRNDQQIES